MAKPSSTGISKEKVLDQCAKLGEWRRAHQASVKSRLLRRLHRAGDITFNQLAFLDIETLIAALESKALTLEEANEIHSKTPGEFVMVPLKYMRTLMAHWNRYIYGPPGMSFGEAFGFEGGGRGGKGNTRKRINYINRAVPLALQVITLRDKFERAGNSISLEAAYESIAEEAGAKAATVRHAYKEFSRHIYEEMELDGLID